MFCALTPRQSKFNRFDERQYLYSRDQLTHRTDINLLLLEFKALTDGYSV